MTPEKKAGRFFFLGENAVLGGWVGILKFPWIVVNHPRFCSQRLPPLQILASSADQISFNSAIGACRSVRTWRVMEEAENIISPSVRVQLAPLGRSSSIRMRLHSWYSQTAGKKSWWNRGVYISYWTWRILLCESLWVDQQLFTASSLARWTWVLGEGSKN